MSILSIDLGERVIQIDLGEITEHGTGGELIYSGNAYLHIDGVEFGSLFIHRDAAGLPTITLGQFSPRADEWVAANPLHAIPSLRAA